MNHVTIPLLVEWAALFWLFISTFAALTSFPVVVRMVRKGDHDGAALSLGLCIGWLLHAILSLSWFLPQYTTMSALFGPGAVLLITGLGTIAGVIHMRTFTRYKFGDIGWLVLVAIAVMMSSSIIITGVYLGELP